MKNIFFLSITLTFLLNVSLFSKQYTYNCELTKHFEKVDKKNFYSSCLYKARDTFSTIIASNLYRLKNNYDLHNMSLNEIKSFTFLSSTPVALQDSSTFIIKSDFNIIKELIKSSKKLKNSYEEINFISKKLNDIYENQKSTGLEIYFLNKQIEDNNYNKDDDIYIENKRTIRFKEKELEEHTKSLLDYNEFISGVNHYFMLDNKKAHSAIKSLIDKGGNNVYFHKILAKIYYNAKEYKKAHKELQACKSYNKDYEIHYMLGNLEAILENNQKALNSYLNSNRINPMFPDNYLKIADLYIQQRNYNKAFNTIHALLSLDSENHMGITTLAEINYYKGNFEKAKSNIEKALEIDNSYYKSYEILGDVYYQKKELLNASKSYKKALSINPNNKNLTLKLRMSSDKDVFSPYSIYDNDNEKRLSPYSENDSLESVYFGSKNEEYKSITESESLQELIEINKTIVEENSLAINSLIDNEGSIMSEKYGITYLYKKKYRDAKNMFLNAIEKNYTNCKPYFLIGYIEYINKNWENSIKFLEEATKLGCENSYFVPKGKNSSKYKISNNKNSNNEFYDYNIFIMLGSSYRYIGNLVKSSINFQRATDIFSNSPITNYELGKVSADLSVLSNDSNKMNYAVKYLKKAAQLGSLDAQLLLDKLNVNYENKK